MVEWKKLGEICIPLKKAIIKQGDLIEKGNYPVINSGITLYGWYNSFNNEGNAFTLASRGEYAGYITYMERHFWAGGLCYPYRSRNEKSVITKYIYQYLKNKERVIMDTLVMRGGIPALNKVDVDKILIPIIPLSEQNRIVGNLDTFTDSIENLKQQIAQRRKQFEFYRDCIFKYVDSKETTWKKLSEIAVIFKGPYITKKGSKEGNVPVVMGGQKAAYYIDNYNSEGESIVISRSGINAGFVSFWNQPIFVSDGYRIDNKDIIVKKFLFHFLKSIEGIINSSKKGAGVPHVQSNYLLNILIPLPPLSEQQRIVSILDTFEASISNLEAQLAQRQKQYEYYRNQLLTFE